MRYSLTFLLVLVTVMLSGCGMVEGIFKAGMWWAFILMAVVVGLILWLVAKFRKK